MRRYKVYLKVRTPLRSGRKGCLVFTVCLQSVSYVSVLHLQQLQGVEAIKHPLRQVSDLISIQHAGKSQHRFGLDTGNDNQVYIYAHTHAQLSLRPLTGNWGSAGPERHLELFLRSGCCSGLCIEWKGQTIGQGNWSFGKNSFHLWVVWTLLSQRCHHHRTMASAHCCMYRVMYCDLGLMEPCGKEHHSQ